MSAISDYMERQDLLECEQENNSLRAENDRLRNRMDKLQAGVELMACFPGSFINRNGEFIAHPNSNQYFILYNCETLLDVKCKVLEWLSRGACKAQPYKTETRNEGLHRAMRERINRYLGTDFTHEDMELIYTYLGNACNHQRTIRFVESGYDMNILREIANGKNH